MRFISSRAHGVLDYLTGALLIALPWIMGFSDRSAATWIMVVLGVITIIYSMVTRYELGFASLISLRVHLWLDLLSGALLAVSPWLFGFSQEIYMPHLLIGLFEIVVVAFTDPASVTKAHEPKLSKPNPAHG